MRDDQRSKRKSSAKQRGRERKREARGAESRSESRQASAATASSSRASRAGRTTSPRERVREYPRNPLPEQHLDGVGLESELTPRPQYRAPAYRAAGKLSGKRALITGGDSGIGRAVAVLYAREGADVAIVYLPDEQSDADETRAAVEAEGRRCVLVPGDLTEAAFCRQAVEDAVSELGGLDILVNNAATQESVERLEDVSDDQFDRTFKTNIYAYFRVTKAALPHLRAGSAIVNTGSITGLQGQKTLLDYSATKGAIHAFTKSLAQNLVPRGIRVNCIAPGPVWTPLNPADEGTSPEEIAKFGAEQPMKRPAQPEEIAPAYVYFASEADSSYVTGEILSALGGETTAG
jgi:NAD(P)-dependent dehydrogenase (short-subunit alcohol dehydrogenase family)